MRRRGAPVTPRDDAHQDVGGGIAPSIDNRSSAVSLAGVLTGIHGAEHVILQIASVHGLARRLTDGRHLDLIERVGHGGRRSSDGLAPTHGCEGITGGGRAAVGVDGDDGIDGGIDRSTELNDHQIVDVVVAVVFVDVNHLVLLSGVAIGTSCHAADAGEGGDGIVVLLDETDLGAVDILTMGCRDD